MTDHDEGNEKIEAVIQGLRALASLLEAACVGDDVPAVTSDLAQCLRDALKLVGTPAAVDASQAERLQAILDAIPAHIVLLDSEGCIVAVNRSGKCFGTGDIRPDSWRETGRRYVDLYLSASGPISPDVRVVADGIESVLKGTATSFALDYEWPSESDPRWFRVVVTPLSPGMLDGVVVVQYDITERKHAQEEIRISEEKYRLLFATNPNPMWVYDLETLRFLEVNEAAVERYGWSAEEFLGMTIADIRPEEDVPALLDTVGPITRGMEPAGVWRHRTRNGHVLRAEIFAHALSIDGRRTQIVRAVDVTDRELAEERLRISEERLAYVARATVDTIWDWDVTTNQVWWSQGVDTQFGYAADAVTSGLDWWTDRLHPDERESVLAGLHAASEGDAPAWEACYRFRRFDGSYVDIVDHCSIIRDADGRAVRMVGGMTDVTERRVLEEQLRQSQRLEAVGQLTGGVAHDFNNLLTVILGNAELLVENLEDAQPQLAELAGMISTAAAMGAELTRRLLAFARRQPLEPQIVDPRELVAGMEMMFKRAVGAHIAMSLFAGPGRWQASIDPGQLENALLNLCLNARDAMSESGRLVIETQDVHLDAGYTAQNRDVVPGEYVMIAVTDTGCGIAPDVMARVFEPFYTSKQKGHGTGLGLSMVYGFIRQSRGHIKLYSEVGVGTTVKMYLPRHVGGSMERTADSVAPASGGGETVLLVEDEELVLRYAREQLRILGYEVICARSGAEAIDLITTRDDIDVLFTDVVLAGGVGGKQIADAAWAVRPGLPVLFTSGFAEDAIVHNGRLDPGVSLLQKPYRRLDLATKLRQALSKSIAVVAREVS